MPKITVCLIILFIVLVLSRFIRSHIAYVELDEDGMPMQYNFPEGDDYCSMVKEKLAEGEFRLSEELSECISRIKSLADIENAGYIMLHDKTSNVVIVPQVYMKAISKGNQRVARRVLKFMDKYPGCRLISTDKIS